MNRRSLFMTAPALAVAQVAEHAKDAALNLNAASFATDNLPALLADTRRFPTGSLVVTLAEGYSYDVVESEEHLTTAGGVKLRVRADNNRLTPQMFGALADGVANDHNAILAAHSYAGEREVLYPAGEYNIPIPDGYDVYLAVGAGNMSGENRGPIDRGGQDASNPRVLQYAMSGGFLGTVILAKQPMAFPNPQTGVSPALQFAIEGPLKETPANRSIIIVPAAVAGSSSGQWRPGQVNYRAAVNAANAAMAHGTGTNVFRGIICAPFGADAGVLTGAQYTANLRDMITGFRSDITGASEARFLTMPFVPEFSGASGGIDIVHANIHTVTKRAATGNQLGTGNQENGYLPNADGAREMGRRMGDALLDITGRRWFMDFMSFWDLDPNRPQARLEAGVNWVGQRPLGLVLIYERGPEPVSVGKSNTARGHRFLIEDNNELPATDTIYQWAAHPESNSGATFETFFTINKSWEGKAKGNPQTTSQFMATGMPGEDGFITSIGAYTEVLGIQNGWGGVFVVSDGRRVDKPEGMDVGLFGIEIDIQPSIGSVPRSGAGILVNNFRAPAPFAAVAVAGSSGGEWKTGIFLGKISGKAIDFSSAVTVDRGIDMRNGSYSTAAIDLGESHNVRFTGGGTTSELIARAGGKFVQSSNGLQSIEITGALQSDPMLELFTASQGHSFATFYVVTGPTANAAMTTLSLRANGINNRSINAGGTINASGADYAEYEIKRDDCGMVAAGDLIGFDIDGLITDRFADAVSFAVKSTNPNLVGGDMWDANLTPPEKPEYGGFPVTWEEYSATAGVDIERPIAHSIRPDSDLKAKESAWDAAWGTFESEKTAHLAGWQNGPEMAAYRKAKLQFETDLEDARMKVDRIAYCGKCPCNVFGAVPGQWVVPADDGTGGITATLVNDTSITFEQFRLAVGRVRRIMQDGRAEIAVGVK